MCNNSVLYSCKSREVGNPCATSSYAYVHDDGPTYRFTPEVEEEEAGTQLVMPLLLWINAVTVESRKCCNPSLQSKYTCCRGGCQSNDWELGSQSCSISSNPAVDL